LDGGRDAAKAFMLKVREYLVSLGSLVKDPESVQVVVKAYANLSGIAYACVRDKILNNGEMNQFGSASVDS
jgi:hypothetical protein